MALNIGGKIGRKAGSHRYTSCATFHAVPSLTDDRQRQGWHAAKFRMFVWLGVGRATESPPTNKKGAPSTVHPQTYFSDELDTEKCYVESRLMESPEHAIPHTMKIKKPLYIFNIGTISKKTKEI